MESSSRLVKAERNLSSDWIEVIANILPFLDIFVDIKKWSVYKYTYNDTANLNRRVIFGKELVVLQVEHVKFNLQRETLVDKIVDVLEDRILTGELLPETRLSETGVAKEFGVSRVPAREALQRLEEMNLVRKTHLGREVAKFRLEEFREIHELKNVVGSFGAMKGALHATDEEMYRIESVIERMKDCVKSGDLNELRRCNFEFHDLLVYCSRNQRVIDTYLLLVKQVRWAASLSLSMPDRPVQSTQEHVAIFKAFMRRDAEKVRILVENHTNQSMERILSQLRRKEGKISQRKSPVRGLT